MNILSIDWDYFIKVSEVERFMMFPDGGNEHLPFEMQDLIWTNLYTGAPSLKDIELISSVSEVVQMLRNNVNPDNPIMIAESHKHIYDFIKEHVPKKKINLVNIDFHHDVYTVDKEKVHAGNWLRYIMKEYPRQSTFTWIAREDSETHNIPKARRLKVIMEDFSSIRDMKWDLVYICRSGMWSPPHLDQTFSHSFEWLKEEHFMKFEQYAFTNRYNEEFLANVEAYRTVVEMAKDMMKNRRE